MIEKTLFDFLSKKMEVDVYTETPNHSVVEFITIEKVGGSKREHLFTSSFAIQSYSSSKYKTALLNEKVKLAMEDLIEVGEICKVDLENDYDFTDTETKRYRYQAIFEITHY